MWSHKNIPKSRENQQCQFIKFKWTIKRIHLCKWQGINLGKYDFDENLAFWHLGYICGRYVYMCVCECGVCVQKDFQLGSHTFIDERLEDLNLERFLYSKNTHLMIVLGFKCRFKHTRAKNEQLNMKIYTIAKHNEDNSSFFVVV